jgi:homoserine kinase
MYRVKITLPATITDLGPGLGSLGLAIGLYTTVELSLRDDQQLIVDTEGEGTGGYGIGLRHPVALAIMRVFQQQERAILGLNVKVHNQIPINSGLGAEAAFWVAGVIGANNMLSTPYKRADLTAIAAQISGLTCQTITSIMGGLTASFMNTDGPIYRALPVRSLYVAIVLPELERYQSDIATVKPERVPLTDALFNLSRVPLLVEALRTGDIDLISQLIDDRLHVPFLKSFIQGYDDAVEAARAAGALAVTLSGDGPAMIAFARANHDEIATQMKLAFVPHGIKARSWIVPIDTQGVVISVAGNP